MPGQAQSLRQTKDAERLVKPETKPVQRYMYQDHTTYCRLQVRSSSDPRSTHTFTDHPMDFDRPDAEVIDRGSTFRDLKTISGDEEEVSDPEMDPDFEQGRGEEWISAKHPGSLEASCRRDQSEEIKKYLTLHHLEDKTGLFIGQSHIGGNKIFLVLENAKIGRTSYFTAVRSENMPEEMTKKGFPSMNMLPIQTLFTITMNEQLVRTKKHLAG
jgi:hypothetical protein